MGKIGEERLVEALAADEADRLCGRLRVANGTIRKEGQGRASVRQVFGFEEGRFDLPKRWVQSSQSAPATARS
jgi:hypothetical protein